MFKEHDPILWVIDLKKHDANPSEYFSGKTVDRQKVDTFELQLIQRKTAEWLENIKQKCEAVVKEYARSASPEEESIYLEKVIEITENLKILFRLIKEFGDLLQNPPSKPPEDPENK